MTCIPKIELSNLCDVVLKLSIVLYVYFMLKLWCFSYMNLRYLTLKTFFVNLVIYF